MLVLLFFYGNGAIDQNSGIGSGDISTAECEIAWSLQLASCSSGITSSQNITTYSNINDARRSNEVHQQMWYVNYVAPNLLVTTIACNPALRAL